MSVPGEPAAASGATEVASAQVNPEVSPDTGSTDMAAAYAPSNEPEHRGFFGRILATVNPF
jgi:hypothetical protein